MRHLVNGVALVAALVLAAALLPARAHAESTNRAAALAWPGYADTDLPFSSFFSSNFTISVRFMLQYPRAYRGPIISSTDGTGGFELGMADHRAGTTGVKLALRVGGNEYHFSSDALVAGKWQQLTLTRTFTFPLVTPQGSTFSVYLNGQRLCVGVLVCGNGIFVPGSGPAAPSGNVRIGRSAASRAGVSATRSDADADALPKPNVFETGVVKLPFEPGQAWRVSQGYGATRSHNGYAAFSYDFRLAGQQSAGKDPNPNAPGDPSCGEPVHAGRSGTLVYATDAGGGGPDPDDFDGPNFALESIGTNAYLTYMHLFTGSIHDAFWGVALPPSGNPIPVATGRRLGTVGTRNGCHLHFATSNSTGDLSLDPLGSTPSLPAVTFPRAFVNYRACDADGGEDCTMESNWYDVSYDVPREGQWVRAK